MDFGSAIKLLKEGKKLARKGWDGVNQYIELVKNISYKNQVDEIINVEHLTTENKAIAFVDNISGIELGWFASQADILAEDWEIKKDHAEDKKKVKCPFCGEETYIEFNCMINDYMIDTVKTVTYTGFCNNCGGMISRFIDKDKKEFIGKNEFYKAHPEKYDLKKYIWFLLKNLELIKKHCENFLENNKTLTKEIKDLVKYCSDVATPASSNTDDRFDFLIELAQDLLDEKYEIIINKKGD